MFQLGVFDLDGTLTDTLDSLSFSVNETLKEMGYSPLDREQCRSFVGNGARVLMEKSLKASGDVQLIRIEEGMKRFGRIFDANCTYHVVPYEGIPELLTAMKLRDIRLAVLTNKPHKQAIHVVEEIFGKRMFDWIQGQQDGIPRKPDPFAAIHIAESLGIEPENSLYIGDSEVDIATGQAAGMRTYGVTWGFRSRQQLIDSGALYIVDKPIQILEEIVQGGD